MQRLSQGRQGDIAGGSFPAIEPGAPYFCDLEN